MRDLASAAGVSFATPFNLFGSKLSIMRALSTERIELMHERMNAAALPRDAIDRVLQVVAIAAETMTEKSSVNRAVMGAIGAPGAMGGETFERSRALWSAALGDGEGLRPDVQALGRSVIPEQLAIAFRGALSFWTAGEFRDDDLRPQALAIAALLLLGFADPGRREALMEASKVWPA